MRCLTLADGLSDHGARCSFFVNCEAPAVVPALAESGYSIHVLEHGEDAFERALAAAHPEGCDVLIIDHYNLGLADERSVARYARRIAVIDDLADRPHSCDLLLDQTVGRSASDYRALVGTGTALLLGQDYALLRRAFGQRRSFALSRRSNPKSALLISMGLTDVNGITGRLMERLVESTAFMRFDVLLGPSASSVNAVKQLARRDHRIKLHGTNSDVAELMTQADLAIGGGGTSSWERCCLGLPTVLIELAANQAKIVAELVSRGAAVAAHDVTDAGVLAETLVKDVAALSVMSRKAAALVDGKGVDRVREAIAALF